MSAFERDLRSLPKGHLHVHLEAMMRPTTYAELAQTYGISAPDLPLSPAQGHAVIPFDDFIAGYRGMQAVIRTPEDLQRIVIEAAQDAEAAGVVWLEPALYPSQHRELGSDETVLRVVLDAVAEAPKVGVGIGIMVSADRTRPPAEAEDLARLAARYVGRGVVSFGLAGDETYGHTIDFAPAFAIARRAGLLAAPHAGELRDSSAVLEAMRSLGAHRIQHGVRASTDREVTGELIDFQVCLDVCPTSNVVLGAVDSWEAHPLARLLADGVQCSLGADDPLLFGVDVLDEYEIARHRLGIDDVALAGMARNSLRYSGAPPDLADRALAGIDDWLSNPTTSKENP